MSISLVACDPEIDIAIAKAFRSNEITIAKILNPTPRQSLIFAAFNRRGDAVVPLDRKWELPAWQKIAALRSVEKSAVVVGTVGGIYKNTTIGDNRVMPFLANWRLKPSGADYSDNALSHRDSSDEQHVARNHESNSMVDGPVKPKKDVESTSSLPVPKNDKAIVGITECNLYGSETVTHADQIGTLVAGTVVTVEARGTSVVRVATGVGTKGWVQCCCLCTPSEFNRRTKTAEVPLRLVCVHADVKGELRVSGELAIKNNQFVCEGGQGIWMDESAKGKTFNVGSQKLVGDPAVLFLYKDNKEIARLPIWPTSP